jgi:hypothetical protein
VAAILLGGRAIGDRVTVLNAATELVALLRFPHQRSAPGCVGSNHRFGGVPLPVPD